MKYISQIGIVLLGAVLLLLGCQKNDTAPVTPTPTPVATPFVPKDSLISNNVFQVEFSTDSRSMVYCEQLLLSGGQATIYYADVDLNTGLPNLATRQAVDVIQGQGWPYWGHDRTGRFFVFMNKNNQIKIARRTGKNTLAITDFGTVNGQSKSLINVSADSTKAYFWVNYVVSSAKTGTTGTGRDSLFAFRSDNPGKVYFINAELRNPAGGAYELTFPRWLANSELLAYPFRPDPAQPYFDMKFWDGSTQTSTPVTNDITRSVLNHHVDDLPFKLPNQPGNTYLFSAKGGRTLSIYRRTGETGYFSEIENYTTPTTLNSPTILTSFEPFTVNNKTYGAYQVYESTGGGIPGNALGEIWLKGILGDDTQLKISTFAGVAVDPEYVIGNRKIWIYYYAKTIGASTFDLRRCETPLTR